MCDPFSIGIALAVGGLGASQIGNNQAAGAQARAQSQERARQQKMTQQQEGYFNDSLGKATAITDPTQQAAAVDKRNADLSAAIQPSAESSYMPGSSSAPQLVKTANDKAVGNEKADASRLALALAQMGAPGQQLFDANIGIGRNSQGIGQIAQSKASSADVLNAELQAAAQKGGTLRGLGGLATSIGGMMIGSGLGAGGLGSTGAISGSTSALPFGGNFVMPGVAGKTGFQGSALAGLFG